MPTKKTSKVFSINVPDLSGDFEAMSAECLDILCTFNSGQPVFVYGRAHDGSVFNISCLDHADESSADASQVAANQGDVVLAEDWLRPSR